MTALVVEASVWVGAADATDPFSKTSRDFFAAVTAQGLAIELPALARIEVACALGRRLNDADRARQITEAMLRSPLVAVQPMDTPLVDAAIAVGTRLFLRSADAIYAAFAERVGGALVAWDEELVQRANAVTPSEWLEKNR